MKRFWRRKLAKDKKSKIDPETEVKEQRIQDLETMNQILSELVDKYDSELTNMIALQRESTKRLNQATEIIKSIMPIENR
jgi:DNA repair ATPase RecN